MAEITYKIEELLHNPACLDTFSKELQIEFDEIEPGRAVAHMTLRKELENPIGSIHGGALFSFADIVSGVAATAGGKMVTTLNSTIQFLAPAMLSRNSVLTATATAKKKGKTIHVMEVDIADEKEKLIASAQFSFYVLK
ncbi:acyl-CoA thioesterase [Lachnospiraceae bacterium XBB1006]|nr:acyl-CoA thioesterase [Lachnospiraceae bacterium XBB1006]